MATLALMTGIGLGLVWLGLLWTRQRSHATSAPPPGQHGCWRAASPAAVPTWCGWLARQQRPRVAARFDSSGRVHLLWVATGAGVPDRRQRR